MRHAVRNSLILFGILAVLTAGGWAYLHFSIDPKIDTIKQAQQTRIKELREANVIIDQYQTLLNQYQNVQTSLESFPKVLFPTESQSVVYGFINKLSTGKAFVDYNLKYIATDYYTNYGVIRTSLTGTGYFRALYRFIAALEQSAPLTRIRALQLESLTSPDDLGKVDIRMEIASYFYYPRKDEQTPLAWVKNHTLPVYKKPTQDARLVTLLKRSTPVMTHTATEEWQQVTSLGGSGWVAATGLVDNATEVPLTVSSYNSEVSYNPFYPHVHAVPGNTKNLVDVNRSKLIGLTVNSVFLLDQSGQMQTIKRGDEVYLGYLHGINPKHQIAVFRLNKGGVRGDVVLRVERNTN